MAIIRYCWERILAAPLVIVTYRSGRFITTSCSQTRNHSTEVTVHEHIAIRIDCCSLRIIALCCPDVPAPEESCIVDALVLIDCDVFVGYTFLSKCCYNYIARDKSSRCIKSYIAI